MIFMYAYKTTQEKGLCDSCLSHLARRLTDVDCIVLAIVVDVNYLKGCSLQQILEAWSQEYPKQKATKNQVYMSVLKLEGIGFLYAIRKGQALYYNITGDGERILAYIQTLIGEK